jgi:hypothetical protein
MPGFVIPNDDLELVFTAIECASSTLRLRMPSSNNVETMFVQHLPLCDAFKAFIVRGLIVADEHTKISPKTQEH